MMDFSGNAGGKMEAFMPSCKCGEEGESKSKFGCKCAILMRVLGLCIYAVAFFLPAVSEVAVPGGDAPTVLKGSRCAWITVVNSLNPQIWHSKYALAILSGWINPLLVLYLLLLIFPVLVWPRRIVAGAMVAFLIGTWVFFYIYPLVPQSGHILWAVGVLMVLAGELHRREKAELAVD
jgi:small-conductance mechanosensitive channel